MKKHVPYILSVFILLSLVNICLAQKNAGIVPYFKSGGQTFILIADHQFKDRGWASFGGKHVPGETNEQTAVREFHEETKNIFLSQHIENRLNGKVEQEKFVTFFVPVDFVSVFEIINTSLEGGIYNERGFYVWVPLSALFKAIEHQVDGEFLLDKKYLPPDYHCRKLYKPYIDALLEAKETGVLDNL